MVLSTKENHCLVQATVTHRESFAEHLLSALVLPLGGGLDDYEK